MKAPTLNTNPKKEDEDLLATAVISPHDNKLVNLGEYEADELVPELVVTHDAEGYDLIEWIENHKVMEDGSVRLFLVVQNFTDQDVTMHVRRNDQED